MIIGAELDITMTVLSKSAHDTMDSVQFISTKLQGGSKKVDEGSEKVTPPTVMRKSMPQMITTDFPIIAYKGFISDNSELIIANFAYRESKTLILSLQKW